MVTDEKMTIGLGMENNKLIQMLHSLSKIELNRFLDMVNSDYFNKNGQLRKLAFLLSGTYPKFHMEDISKEVLFQGLWPDLSFDEQKLRYALSDLTKLFEEFVAHQKLQRDPVYRNHLLSEYFMENGLGKYARAVIDKSEKAFMKDKKEDQGHYFRKFLLEVDKYEMVSNKREAEVEANLKSVINSVDRYYVINKLKYSCEIINRTNILSGEYEPLLLDEILAYLENNPHEHVPAIAIYYRILLSMLESENEEHYKKLIELLGENESKFSGSELKDMYIYVRNYCTKKINSGHAQYLRELFNLHKTLLANKIIFDDGYLSQWDYKNIVAAGLRLKEYEWTEKFIFQYKGRMQPEKKENAFTYNLALLFYHKGDYGQTLDLLQDVEFTDVFYNLNCKALLLQTYYDLEEIDALYSLMDTFYAYVRRNKKISQYKADGFLNFIKYLKKLNKIRFKPDSDPDAVRQEINQTKYIQNPYWLLAKLDELESNRHSPV